MRDRLISLSSACPCVGAAQQRVPEHPYRIRPSVAVSSVRGDRVRSRRMRRRRCPHAGSNAARSAGADRWRLMSFMGAVLLPRRCGRQLKRRPARRAQEARGG